MLADLPDWLAATPRFRSFAESNRDKIRKKLRYAADDEARLDVRAELRVAALLLADRRFELVFEAYGAGNRGPDFTATFRGGRAFNVEVTRRRRLRSPASLDSTILAKLRQLPPSAANVLLIAADDGAGAPDPGPAMRTLRLHAEQRDEAFFAAHGHADVAAANAGLLRLAAVLTWAETADPDARVAWWVNPGARIALPEPTVRALREALAAQGGRALPADNGL